MPEFILAAATWLVEWRPSCHRDAKPGWLGRHASRPPRSVPGVHEPYVDLKPLDLASRH